MSVHPVRVCPGCDQADNHPRHVIALADGNSANYHMDCCKTIRGCEVCAHQLGDVPKGVKGDKLREHLVALPPKDVEHHESGAVTITARGE